MGDSSATCTRNTPATNRINCELDERLTNADGVSSGDMYLMEKSGFPMEHIVLHGNNKSLEELETAIEKGENERHEEVVRGMRDAIDRNDNLKVKEGEALIQKRFEEMTVKPTAEDLTKPNFNSPVVVAPGAPVIEKVAQDGPNHSIIELANNPDYSVATIEKEAKRIKERGESEVFVSLH